MDTITYELGNNLYINLTNRCSNDCEFCVRNGKTSYYGNELWLEKEPTAEEVLAAVPDKNYDQVVFCGFGEPTFRFAVLYEVGKELRARGYSVRLDTNGQGNLINGENIVPDLARAVDFVNVSLNAYEELIDFAKKCKAAGIATTFSVVDCIGEKEVEKCRAIAKKAGISLRVREMIEDS